MQMARKGKNPTKDPTMERLWLTPVRMTIKGKENKC